MIPFLGALVPIAPWKQTPTDGPTDRQRVIYITRGEATAFYAQASAPKQLRWYDATHDRQVATARKDREEWLMWRFALAQSR